jgi:hypothetical protein
MKRWIWVLAASAACICGCAQHYVMKLSNGMQITADGKPKLKGSTYYYKDAQGQEHAIPQGRVQMIEPTSLAAEESKFTVEQPRKKHWYWPF